MQKVTFPIPKSKEVENSFTPRKEAERNFLHDTITSLA